MKKYIVTLLSEPVEEFIVEANNDYEVYELAKKIFYNTDLLGDFDDNDCFAIGIKELDNEFELYCCLDCDNYDFFETGKCNLCNQDDDEDYDIEELFSDGSEEQKERILNILYE